MHEHPGKRGPAERGAVLIWVASFLMVMVFFVALGVDGAKLAATRIQLQNAADAAALAGASAIDPVNGNGGVILQDVAVARALQTGALNKAFVAAEAPVDIAPADVTFPAANQCRVVVRREAASGTGMVTAFARVVGRPTLDMTATATAILEPATKVCEDLIPLGAIPPTDQQRFQVGCANVYVLKEGGGSGSQGNYKALKFPKCDEASPCKGRSGANELRCLIANGYRCCLAIGDKVDTKTGDNSGPVKQGFEERFQADSDRREGICYSSYTGNGSRVVTVPRVTAPGNGQSKVTILGFSSFFIRAIPGNGSENVVRAEFLYDVSPGQGGPGGTGSDTYALRLLE